MQSGLFISLVLFRLSLLRLRFFVADEAFVLDLLGFFFDLAPAANDDNGGTVVG